MFVVLKHLPKNRKDMYGFIDVTDMDDALNKLILEEKGKGQQTFTIAEWSDLTNMTNTAIQLDPMAIHTKVELT